MIMGQINETAIEGFVGVYPVCSDCGQTHIVRDAGTCWSRLTRTWTLKTIYDTYVCDDCGSEAAPFWKLDKEFRLKRIVRLNNAVRQGHEEHVTVVVTAGLKNRGEEYLIKARRAVADFDQFNGENDPHGEHDFGALTLDGEKLFWKIDYFDLILSAHSPDKANPDVTHRVLTIMLASEY
jgi:predicted RNA-binding Zn-ribbon protein involved in translation (DUF1610 family)